MLIYLRGKNNMGNTKRKLALYAGIAILSSLLVGTVVIVPLYKKDVAEKGSADEIACLHDADCRARLEAAVNQVYSEADYDSIYSAP